MDLFRFTNPAHEMRMEAGVFLPRFETVTWVERYRDAGEVTIESKPEAGIRDLLPEGSLVSHPDSDEIMIIETHTLPDNPGEEPLMRTYGRSFETFLTNRIVGSNREFPHNSVPGEFGLATSTSSSQAVRLVEYHTLAAQLFDRRNALSYFAVHSTVPKPGTQERRNVSRGTVYDGLLNILAVDNLGVRTVRPRGTEDRVILEIHAGRDRHGVIFSTVEGEIDSAEYLWSKKGVKNCALVTGRWVEILVDDVGARGLSRRMMYVDASDIDERFEAYPTGAALTDVKAALRSRGREALAKQKAVALSQATAAPFQPGSVYGTDYVVGDIVTVVGKFAGPKQMRVSEYVHIQDNEGEQGYPSFAEVEEA